MQEVKKAEINYMHEKLTGKRGKIRQLLRRLGEGAPTFAEWLKVLPDDVYGMSLPSVKVRR